MAANAGATMPVVMAAYTFTGADDGLAIGTLDEGQRQVHHFVGCR
jgi:hypothetical protein